MSGNAPLSHGFSLRNILPAIWRQDVAFGVLTLLVVLMFVVPLPPLVLDLLLGLNLFVGLTLLLATLYLRSVLDLSTFPTLLLLSTIFRLAVTISTTRAVLAHANAGSIVRGFGEFVVAGNVVVGLVVFLIVSVVQFIVVTKGAERIAEVAARFTLDALPGKQMSIDADLRSGDISKEEARRRRFALERESQFFGAMDGAMRFVKGDAIASLIVVFVNLVGGLLIATIDKGMSLSAAGRTYSILSVGDGLVAQIPAMFAAVASGILVTRVVGEDSGARVGQDIVRQITSEPNAILIAAAGLVFLGFLPGFPTGLLSGLAALAVAPIVVTRWRAWRASQTVAGDDGAAVAAPALSAEPLPQARFSDPIVARGNAAALEALTRAGLATRLEERTREAATRIGLALPLLTFRVDETAPARTLILDIEGIAKQEIPLGEPNMDTGALETALLRAVEREFAAMLSVDDVVQWLESLKTRHARLVADVQQRRRPEALAPVLRRLLADGAPLAHPRAMLEVLARPDAIEKNPDSLIEACRLAMRPQILNALHDGKARLGLMTLARPVEESLRQMIGGAASLAQNDQFERQRAALAQQIAAYAKAQPQDLRPVLVVAAQLRAPIAAMLAEYAVETPVVSASEVEGYSRCTNLGSVGAAVSSSTVQIRPHSLASQRR